MILLHRLKIFRFHQLKHLEKRRLTGFFVLWRAKQTKGVRLVQHSLDCNRKAPVKIGAFAYSFYYN